MTTKTVTSAKAAPGKTEHPLEHLFSPRAIAIVGASATDPNSRANVFAQAPKEHGFVGPIYPINPRAKEIIGLKAYPSVLDVPGPLDWVTSSIPAAGVPDLLRQCGKKGVRFVHMYTAGFRETGDRARTELEQYILRVAREEGIRLMGPNCLGVYYPAKHLSFRLEFPKESGHIGLLSQSGSNAGGIVNLAGAHGLRFSKGFSYGNALDINESDLLEYLISDSDTHIIGAYIEGVVDGRRFFSLVREATKSKPMVILKGGRTEAGSRAISSHTGSLAGTSMVWDTLCRQTGAIRVFGIDEMVEVLMTFSCGIRPTGKRVAILGNAGGGSVLAADDCNALGLDVPVFSPQLQQRLLPMVNEAGTSVRNPVDAGDMMRSEQMIKAVELIAGSEEVDAFFVNVGITPMNRATKTQPVAAVIRPLREAAKVAGKPFFIVLRNDPQSQASPERQRRFIQECGALGLPVFASATKAGNALLKVLAYYRWKAEEEATS